MGVSQRMIFCAVSDKIRATLTFFVVSHAHGEFMHKFKLLKSALPFLFFESLNEILSHFPHSDLVLKRPENTRTVQRIINFLCTAHKFFGTMHEMRY